MDFHFYYYYIVLCIIEYNTSQTQWEPRVCFAAARRSHVGVMGDSDTRREFLMSPACFTIRSRSHSFSVRGVLWLGSSAETPLKAETGDCPPAG